ncbi:hypothetical protein [Syntrophomonas palmitatica]|uniref:hypothetical protein n=1 Tax=Syntrophomonas palmitatica TaxID=402877 RepID=UPI0006D2C3EF|nr:hypothetical protein [Syntrophomonas palmitatica]
MTINDDYSEGLFYKAMHDLFSQIAEFSNYDLVVGIPFYHEKPEQLQALLYSVDKVLESWIGRRQLIICIGDSAAAENCEMINKLKLPTRK